MKTFFYAACGLVMYICVLFMITSAVSALSQGDTLFKSKKTKAKIDSVKQSLEDTPVKVLEVMSLQKDVERDLIKDSIAQNVENLGNLKPRAAEIKKTLKDTENNLRENILKADGDVQVIEKVYRIDTSPRPVVINVIYPPSTTLVRKRGWIFRRD